MVLLIPGDILLANEDNPSAPPVRIMHDVVTTITRNRQARFVYNLDTKDGRTIPVDIYVMSISLAMEGLTTVVLTFSGIERETQRQFSFSAKLHIFKRTWQLTGYLGPKQVNANCDTVQELLGVIQQVIQ